MFEIKAPPALQQQLRASAGNAVTIEATLTPGKDLRAAVPLEIQVVRP